MLTMDFIRGVLRLREQFGGLSQYQNIPRDRVSEEYYASQQNRENYTAKTKKKVRVVFRPRSKLEKNI